MFPNLPVSKFFVSTDIAKVFMASFSTSYPSLSLRYLKYATRFCWYFFIDAPEKERRQPWVGEGWVHGNIRPVI